MEIFELYKLSHYDHDTTKNINGDNYFGGKCLRERHPLKNAGIPWQYKVSNKIAHTFVKKFFKCESVPPV